MSCIFNSCKTRRRKGFVFSFFDHFCLTPLTGHLFFFSTERPLHHNEKILEQVLEWCTLDCPSSAFLVIKKFSGAKRVADGKGTLYSQWNKTIKNLKMVNCFITCHCVL